MNKNNHVLDLIPEYVLGLLDQDQASQISAHTSQCAECRAEVVAYRNLMDNLAFAAPDAEPSPDIRNKVLAIARPKSADPPRVSWQDQLRDALHFRIPVWGIVSLVLICVLAAGNILLWNQVSNLQGQLASQEVFQFVSLSGTDAAPLATGMLIITNDGEYGTLVVDRLPPLSADNQYQIWLIRDGDRTSGGVFDVSDEGYGVLEIVSDEPLSNFPDFGITVEPAGGSPGPTGVKVLGGEF